MIMSPKMKLHILTYFYENLILKKIFIMFKKKKTNLSLFRDCLFAYCFLLFLKNTDVYPTFLLEFDEIFITF